MGNRGEGSGAQVLRNVVQEAGAVWPGEKEAQGRPLSLQLPQKSL